MSFNRLLLFFCIAALQIAAPARGEDEIVGTVTAWNASHLKIRLPGGDTRQLKLTDKTRFFSGDAPVPQRRVLPNTLVRVAPRDGHAQTVTILEAPR